MLRRMCDPRPLMAAVGWLELGLPDEALMEIAGLPNHQQMRREVLELKLLAQMTGQSWNLASDTARLLCLKDPEEPLFFLRAAYCLHETGDTLAACNWLLRGPKSLMDMAVFHYNLACYLWTLGEERRARSHLRTAVRMDRSLLDSAKEDRDLDGMHIEDPAMAGNKD